MEDSTIRTVVIEKDGSVFERKADLDGAIYQRVGVKFRSDRSSPHELLSKAGKERIVVVKKGPSLIVAGRNKPLQKFLPSIVAARDTIGDCLDASIKR